MNTMILPIKMHHTLSGLSREERGRQLCTPQLTEQPSSAAACMTLFHVKREQRQILSRTSLNLRETAISKGQTAPPLHHTLGTGWPRYRTGAAQHRLPLATLLCLRGAGDGRAPSTPCAPRACLEPLCNGSQVGACLPCATVPHSYQHTARCPWLPSCLGRALGAHSALQPGHESTLQPFLG